MNRQVFRQNLVAGLAVVAVGVVAFALTFGMPGNAPVFPRVASALLAVLGCALFAVNLKAWRNNADGTRQSVEWGSFLYPAHSMAIALAYVLAIPHLGFYFSTAVMMIVYMFYLGARSIKSISLVTAVVLVVVYLVFTFQLGVPLPSGIIL